MFRSAPLLLILPTLVLLGAAPSSALAQDLIVNGTTVTLHGVQRYNIVQVINGGRINVTPFSAAVAGSGNLELIANSILVDATSSISARGAGHQVARCGDGNGPGGGAGGCSVRDSGGGGAHFGRGGRGTKDCPGACTFPRDYEEDCVNSIDAAGLMCTSAVDCRNNDALPSVAGSAYWHSIYQVEFGSAGGDKGCRDGDGFGGQPAVGGPGGGRIVLAAPNGTIEVRGSVRADGRRGCGTGNDSAGGGAGGTVMIAGRSVTISATAVVSAAGGLGGDTRAGAMGQPDSADCPAGSQTGGTCDDCGGGGGGGIVSVLSEVSDIASGATFNVAAALGGTCAICSGEAGGGAGELQINARYIGEFCDGFDNDFDGAVDEGLGTVTCGLGSCTTTIPACTAGAPAACVPLLSGPDCQQPALCNEPRIAVVLDTSASMLQNLNGFATFGDGSMEHPGLDTDGNMQPDDSRMFLAKEALAQVVSSYPEIDFALARYHQDTALNQSCQIAKWIECAGIFATYDEPTDNTGAQVCSVRINATTTVPVRETSVGDEECINYAGSCGGPRRGADIVAGFGADTIDVVRWLDSRETAFNTSQTAGDYCAHSSGNDCELRATGPTPLAGSLQAIQDYILPLIATDPCTTCRGYSVILVTDGDESCNGNPAAEAAILQAAGVDVYVVAVSVLASERAALNAIAAAGGTTAATFVSNPADLVPTLTGIVGGSIRFESCNGADDDCDGDVDEGFVGLGATCDDGLIGACRGSGNVVCRADAAGTECDITTPGATAGTEVCDGGDEDCDGRIDEMLTCTGNCTPTGAEVCNGLDDDCNLLVDETDPALNTPCGVDTGECRTGTLRCIAGRLECIGAQGPRMEVCNGLDENCDGVTDENAVCPTDSLCIESACRPRCAGEFSCAPGLECVVRDEGSFCLPTACALCTVAEACVNNVCVDRCEGVMCEDNETCVRGACRDCNTLGCGAGEVCVNSDCAADPCFGVSCGTSESCFNGTCLANCDDRTCPSGQVCDEGGECALDPCAGVQCAGSEVCLDGSCRADQCDDIVCPRGNVCIPALGCVTDPCATVSCGSGRVCGVRDDGQPQCRTPGEVPVPEGDNVLVSGNGGVAGCAAVPASESGEPPMWPGWLLLVGVAVALMRRRGAK